MKKLFLDSDIILDVLLIRPYNYEAAANLIAFAGQFRFVTSPVVFVNVHYFLDKYDRINKMHLLNSLRPIISIIDVGESIINKALKSNFQDFEDAVQYYSAVAAKVDFIITRNTKDYKQSAIPVLTAEQFLRTL